MKERKNSKLKWKTFDKQYTQKKKRILKTKKYTNSNLKFNFWAIVLKREKRQEEMLSTTWYSKLRNVFRNIWKKTTIKTDPRRIRKSNSQV